MVDVTGLTIDQGVVGGGVAFLCHYRPSMKDIFELGSDELRSSAERVAVLAEFAFVFLNCNFLFFTKLGQLATIEQIPDMLGSLDLAGMGARDRVNERMVRAYNGKFNFSSPHNMEPQNPGTDVP
jgi:hypothetical protein